MRFSRPTDRRLLSLFNIPSNQPGGSAAMALPSRDIVILAVGQALSSTVVSLLTSVSSLTGALLAPVPSLSTVPVTATVLGTLAMIYPAALIMGRLGRRGGFLFKAAAGVLGGAICVLGVATTSFAILVAGTFLLGIFTAFSQYYRFAAIDAARTPDERASAVATVTGAGVIGGIAGPFLGGSLADAAPALPYAGAFAALSIVCVLLAVSQALLSADLGRDPAATATASAPATGVHMSTDFVRASAICAIGFAVMTLTMNAAPLSLHHDGIAMHASTIVLQTHFTLMYLPSLFNAVLVGRLGLRGLIAAGIAANAAGCLLGLATAPSLRLYVVELGLSGIGWNFMFNGGTLLLAGTYTPAEKTRVQGLNSLLVDGANVAASLLAGVLMGSFDWRVINLVCAPLLLVAAAALRPRAGVETIAKDAG
jgi:MFS family permease